MQLLPANAPLTVNNFVYLAGYHYFDGIVFHRVVKGFVDQGGDPTGTGTGSPGYQFADELPKSPSAYDAGALAMANSGANTNGSQFFLVVGSGGQQLTPPNYSMFGQIINGINIINQHQHRRSHRFGGHARRGPPHQVGDDPGGRASPARRHHHGAGHHRAADYRTAHHRGRPRPRPPTTAPPASTTSPPST